ncbi:hypothetical protein ABT294_43035 [Nonomuraea sp. NPDC000554]|uniref:hypothetical protein n=1 Tax=Nonomuraea sp. NPDC000554 TaxID=3154259 RepID=UPI00331E634E
MLIDVPLLQPRFVRIDKALITVGGFQRTHDSKAVGVRWGKNGKSIVRQYDLTGAVKRTWHVRGRLAGEGLGAFTPSGRRFVTACTSLEKAARVWDTRTGNAVTRIRLGFSVSWGTVLGWYDDVYRQGSGHREPERQGRRDADQGRQEAALPPVLQPLPRPSQQVRSHDPGHGTHEPNPCRPRLCEPCEPCLPD